MLTLCFDTIYAKWKHTSAASHHLFLHLVVVPVDQYDCFLEDWQERKKITLSIFASAECLIGGSGMKGQTPQRHFRCKLEVEKRPFQYNTANAIYLNGLNPKKIFLYIYLSSLHGCGYAGVVFGRQGGLHPEVVTSQFLGS